MTTTQEKLQACDDVTSTLDYEARPLAFHAMYELIEDVANPRKDRRSSDWQKAVVWPKGTRFVTMPNFFDVEGEDRVVVDLSRPGKHGRFTLYRRSEWSALFDLKLRRVDAVTMAEVIHLFDNNAHNRAVWILDHLFKTGELSKERLLEILSTDADQTDDSEASPV